MTQTIQARDLTLHDIKAKFGLRLAEDEQFFWEWSDGLPTITDLEKRSLDQGKLTISTWLSTPCLKA